MQGSGWGWLGWCKNDKKLKIVTTQNQDPAVTMVRYLCRLAHNAAMISGGSCATDVGL